MSGGREAHHGSGLLVQKAAARSFVSSEDYRLALCLLKSMLLMVLFTVRSERQFREQLDYDLLFISRLATARVGGGRRG